MIHSKTLRFAMQFGQFAITHKMWDQDLADIITLAKGVYAATERNSDKGTDESRKNLYAARGRLETKVGKMGFSVLYNGFWPSLAKDGCIVEIPSDK